MSENSSAFLLAGASGWMALVAALMDFDAANGGQRVRAGKTE